MKRPIKPESLYDTVLSLNVRIQGDLTSVILPKFHFADIADVWLNATLNVVTFPRCMLHRCRWFKSAAIYN